MTMRPDIQALFEAATAIAEPVVVPVPKVPPLPTDPREAFEQVYAKLLALRAEESALYAKDSPDQQAFEAEVMEAARAKSPKVKKLDLAKAVSIVGEAAVADLKAKYAAPLEARYNQLRDQRKTLEEELGTLADNAPIRVVEGAWKCAHSAYSGAYRSAGPRYDRGSAELRAEEFRDVAGVPAEVRESKASFEVWIAVESDLDVQIARRKAAFTIREWVRRCWSKGLQPRVFQAFLPHDYEAKHGLDYFGGETKSSIDQKDQ
jgi:hypothetical protein